MAAPAPAHDRPPALPRAGVRRGGCPPGPGAPAGTAARSGARRDPARPQRPVPSARPRAPPPGRGGASARSRGDHLSRGAGARHRRGDAARDARLGPGRVRSRGPPVERADGLPRRELGQPHEQGRRPRRARPDDRLERSPAPRRRVELHGLPGGRASSATGAHSYDHWFDWKPSRSREEAAAELALEPDPRSSSTPARRSSSRQTSSTSPRAGSLV